MVLTHTLYEEKIDEMVLIMQERTKMYYFFLFMVKNKKEQKEKKSYIFLRKDYSEMRKIFNNTVQVPLIQDNDEVQVMRSHCKFELMYFE